MTTIEATGRLAGRTHAPTVARRSIKALVRFMRRKPLGAFGAIVVVTLVTTAALADVIAPYDPLAQNAAAALQPPGADYLAGTDQFGRDLFSRLVHGARVSLFVGVGAVVLALVPGTILGMTSAYLGGAFDYFVQRVVDAFQAIPGVILLISIMVVLGGSIPNVIIALAIPAMIRDSRIMRGASMSISRSEYVMAARALGASDPRIIFRHVLPNIASPIIVVASLGFGGFILAEATLSFLGFGVQPPAPAWGGMLSAEGRAYMFAAPWLLWGPAIALSMVIFGANMFGDALRDELDPRLKGTR